MVITWGKTGVFCDNLPLLFHCVFKRLILQGKGQRVEILEFPFAYRQRKDQGEKAETKINSAKRTVSIQKEVTPA